MKALTHYIQHPEDLSIEAVNELELLLERYPYFEAARLLYVQGLYQLQDDRFGPQLRKAAIYVSDRSRLFDLIEGPNYELHTQQPQRRLLRTETTTTDRTQDLIDTFLSAQPEMPRSRKPVAADAHSDYMAYLMQQQESAAESAEAPVPQEEESTHQDQLINNFIDSTAGRISLPDTEEEDEPMDLPADDEDTQEVPQESPTNAFFTETLAQIYIKQGKYVKAMEIIKRLSLAHPQKNRYFADQLRFLEKLVINQQAQS